MGRRWCAGPAPCRRRAGPRPASRPRPSRRRRRARRPGRRPARCRRRSRPGRGRRRARPSWGAPPSIVARRAAAAASRSRSPAPSPRHPAAPRSRVPGLEDRAPAGAAAQVGGSARSTAAWSSAAVPLPEGGQPHDDPRRAEPALAGAGGGEGVGPTRLRRRVEPVDGGDRAGRPPGGPASRRRPAARRRPARCSSRTGPGGCSRPWAERTPRRSRRTSSSEAPVVGDLDLAPVDLELQTGRPPGRG